MITFKQTLLAASLAMAAGGAQAVTFGTGSNSIYYNNLENQYRSDAACAVGGCLGTGTGPAGYQLVDPTIAGNIAAGDIFAGVINVQNNNYASGSWMQGPTDQFSGYFAQQVMAVGPVGTAAEITFGTVAADPFGILAAGEMFRLYTQSGAGTTTFTDFTAGSTGAVGSVTRVQDVITLATDGVFWGSLGLATVSPDNFAYAIDDLTAPGTSTTTESFLALTLMLKGPSYNAGPLQLINDKNESIVGGVTGALLCTAAEIADPTKSCAQFVATSEIELNSHNWWNGDASSPFIYASNDPAVISVPEPATLALLGLGLVGLAGMRRRAA